MYSNGTILSTAFDDYIIQKQIGQGGSGTVFLARNSDDEIFAIKSIDKHSANKSKIKRFRNEMNFCLRTSHKYIIQILDYGSYKTSNIDSLFYVMPYFDSNLRNEINKGIEPERIIDIFLQLLSGISHAHNKEIWHRDIKPENILYDSIHNTVVIADFGIAHFCEDEIITAIETKATDRLANFTYASPEQRVKGLAVDGRADVYSLGVILNEMFTKSVIAGSNYKKIADVAEEYAFLDKLIDKIISQSAADRLYPIKNLEIELLALLKAEQDKQELKKIVDREISKNENNDPLFEEVKLKDVKYGNGQLRLYLDKKINSTWENILRSGSYSYSSLYSYPPSAFSIVHTDKEHTIFYVNIPTSDANSIEKIVVYFKSWLPVVSSIYKHQEEQKRQTAIDREIAQREQEIRSKEKEMEINEKLKSLRL